MLSVSLTFSWGYLVTARVRAWKMKITANFD